MEINGDLMVEYVVYNLQFSARGGNAAGYAIGFQKYLRTAMTGRPDLDSSDVKFDTKKTNVSLKVAVGNPKLLEFISQYVRAYNGRQSKSEHLGRLRIVSMGVETPGLDARVKELEARVGELEGENRGYEEEVAAYETALEDASVYESEASDLRARVERYERLFTEEGVPPYSVVEESPELQQTLLDLAVEIFGERYQDDSDGVEAEMRTDIECARTKQMVIEKALTFLRSMYE